MIKAGKVVEEKTKINDENLNQKTPRKPDEPYQDILAFSEKDEIILFKRKNCKLSVSIGILSSGQRPVVCGFDTGTGTNLIRAEILDQHWLDSIRHIDLP